MTTSLQNSLQPRPQAKVTQATAGGVLQRKCSCGQHTGGGDCAECRRKGQMLQRQATRQTTPASVPPIVHEVLRAPGQSLDSATRTFFESRFEHDFSHVRVHTDPRAAESARAVNALAYTVGRNIVLGSGQSAQDGSRGNRLLAHELTHVIQQNSANTISPRLVISTPQDSSEQEADAVAEGIFRNDQSPSTSVQAGATLQRVEDDSGTPGTGASSPAPSSPNRGASRPRRLNIDVLAAEDPDDFLVRAAAMDLGTDIRVRSMEDMISQVSSLATEGSCVASLEIFNHGSPLRQTVAGGNKLKSRSGEIRRRPRSGFSLGWLFDGANRDALHRLRSSFCCNGETRWFGCSTAGVSAEGGTRTEREKRSGKRRYTGYRAGLYQSVEDAAAHGATRFRAIGSINAQSWANALCTPITAATDFNSWNVRGSGYTRTVIYGGQELRFAPQADVGCACDPETGRVSGTAPGTREIRQRAVELRQQALRPTYERARSVTGREQGSVTESEEQRSTQQAEQLGQTISGSVLRRAGFARGARPTTPEEALRVVAPWGLDIDRITSSLPTLSASTSEAVRGRRVSADLAGQQRSLEAALTQRGRETFMSALLEVRRDRFWNEHLRNNTIYIFPDLSGENRWRGYTQTGTQTDENGHTRRVYIIHISRDMLNGGQVDLVVSNLIHELTHTAEHNIVGRAMRSFHRDLAELLANHPEVEALRASATDTTAARDRHVSQIRQMLYEATSYAEGEILAHLQQLSHQPAITINGRSIRASDFILEQVTRYIAQLRRIGMPRRVLTGAIRSIYRRAMALYDRRIAATPADSRERRRMEANKRLASSIFRLALTNSGDR